MDRVVRRKRRSRLPGAVRGLLIGFSESSQPLVDFPSNPTKEPLAAISLVDLKHSRSGEEIVLLFEDNDPSRPMIVGCVKDRAGEESPKGLDVLVDGQRITLSADKEIVLRCGESSITLTRAGKVLIRGAYLLSRSTGANRIQGGSVQLN